jgi:hypothetical protein
MAMSPRLLRPIARRQAPTFSPLSLTGLQLWLDATDSSSITLNSGNVSEWADKSPEGNDATQATAISQPAYETGSVNGLAAVTFDGTNGFLDVTIPGIDTNGDAYFAWVCEPVGSGTGDGYSPSVSVLTSNSTDYGALHYIKSDLTGASYPFYDGAGGSYDGQGSYSYGQPFVLTFRTAGGTFSVYINGSLEGTSSVDDPPGFPSAGLRLGAQESPSRFSNHKLCEVVVAFGPQAGDVEKIEGYLAHKWGLAGSLPSDHPYKSVPPS